MYVLVVQTGKYKGKRIKVSGPEVLIGRDEKAGIRIGSDDVSRQHCLLTPTDEGVAVRDLDSRNGTFVDGVPIPHTEDALLTPGSTLSVGPMTFQLATTETARPKRGGKAAADGALSDDDISAWLTEGDTSDAMQAADTTIIKGRSALSTAAAPIKPALKREFKSVAEEAEDIIRRYRESLGEDSADADPDA
ncbi:MAG: FHA domain-containing protein [Planctomycetota bacterium]|nr:MAG: FHA domain-containing protein [Planctomycetota bacterium]REJ93496.1 MAG: FHA domain-containing protein [Planctomycetota bacterium]REK26146.1 MAG: FHA domain-containing protein [Planctomycetota bacterium]REK33515.1 MAG: FHA domain-containing protein [Planctomycetota bacterium]